MNEVFIRVVVRRFFECMVVNIGLSALCTMIFAAEFIPSSQMTICVGLSIGVLVYIVINMSMLNHCYFDMSEEPDGRIYLKSNILAYGIFAVINLIVYFLANSEGYTWFFAITKFAKYMPFGINTLVSAIIFHVIMFAVIALVPVRMKRIVAQRKEMEEEGYY